MNDNPDILSHAFVKQGNHVSVVIAHRSEEIHIIPFLLRSSSDYNYVDNSWTKYTFAEYLNLLLTQQSYPRRIDYKHAQDFIYL